MIKLDIPIPEDKIRELKAGDTVLLSGVMVTARDAGHKLMVEERPDFLCVGGSGTLVFQTVEIFRQIALPAVKRGLELGPIPLCAGSLLRKHLLAAGLP